MINLAFQGKIPLINHTISVLQGVHVLCPQEVNTVTLSDMKKRTRIATISFIAK